MNRYTMYGLLAAALIVSGCIVVGQHNEGALKEPPSELELERLAKEEAIKKFIEDNKVEIIRENFLSPVYKTPIKASYVIGSYKADPKKYGISCIDMPKMRRFLESIPDSHYEIGDVIEIDGLKWCKQKHALFDKKVFIEWTPYPNPPIPTLEKGEDPGKHIREYAEWIDNHPHFCYPPLPMPHKH